MSREAVEESIRPLFERAADAATVALDVGKTGRWEVFNGFLPEAVIMVSMARMDDLSARIFSVTYPYIFKSVTQTMVQTVDINRDTVGAMDRAEQAIALFRERGPELMSYVLADCAVRLIRAGVPSEALKDMVDAAVVQDVMEG